MIEVLDACRDRASCLVAAAQHCASAVLAPLCISDSPCAPRPAKRLAQSIKGARSARVSEPARPHVRLLLAGELALQRCCVLVPVPYTCRPSLSPALASPARRPRVRTRLRALAPTTGVGIAPRPPAASFTAHPVPQNVARSPTTVQLGCVRPARACGRPTLPVISVHRRGSTTTTDVSVRCVIALGLSVRRRQAPLWRVYNAPSCLDDALCRRPSWLELSCGRGGLDALAV